MSNPCPTRVQRHVRLASDPLSNPRPTPVRDTPLIPLCVGRPFEGASTPSGCQKNLLVGLLFDHCCYSNRNNDKCTFYMRHSSKHLSTNEERFPVCLVSGPFLFRWHHDLLNLPCGSLREHGASRQGMPGAVVNFASWLGTGAGSHAHDLPELEFSE